MAKKLTQKQMAKVRANLAKTYERQRLPKKNPVLTLFFDGPILLGTDKTISDSPKVRRQKIETIRKKMESLSLAGKLAAEQEMEKEDAKKKFKIPVKDKNLLRKQLETFRITTAIGFKGKNASGSTKTIREVLTGEKPL